jgi:AraC family transcriptional regulator
MKMNYQEQLQKAATFIGQHIDDELTLENLSDQFGISKFHFHRLFTAFTGLSLQQYIRWLRLKRAAHQLIVDKEQSIINIAIAAGFESHEAFTRSFKKVCGFSPSEYRQGASWSYWEQPPYRLPSQGDSNMKVEIRRIDKIRLAVVEHHGDPQLVGDTVNKIVTWAKAQVTSLKPKPGSSFAFAYKDPKTTPPAEFRLDLGIKIPDNFKLDDKVIEKFIPAGRYAVAMHKGSREKIGDTIYPLYRDWVPNSGEELGDLPCIFCYYNFDHEVAETELLTECWLLLK